ncbi:MAG: LysM peptidoglycan-binding domain-containing protein [Clostridiales bacterium]|nr:LysM peptidoglycan-binding domain-containing protein [Clostridiales bacterium]
MVLLIGELSTLADQGRTYLEILRYYYGQNIYITSTDNIQTPFESFPGNLVIGSSGQDVALMQMMLARIRRNYPRIPNLAVDGQYGSQTVATVREFQSVFGLPVTGTVDRRTWYQISNIYAAVMKLAELGGEGHVPPNITFPPSGQQTHTVVVGDTLWRLAQRFGTTVEAIMSLNGLTSTNLRIGQVLRIPGGTTTPPPVGTIEHTVVAGDTLWRLAQRYGTTVEAIMGANNLTSTIINIGQVLHIPTEGGETPAMPPFPGTLRMGSEGNNVRILQQNLNLIADRNMAIPRLVVDGVFGPATQASVLAFQRYYGLTPDGIVGSLTWNRLRDLVSE